MDPVLPLEGTTAFQYIRDNFYGAGQDSFTKPFGQNQELFELCQNVMPVAQGEFRLRHGYSLLVNPNINTVARIGTYQNLVSGARKLLYLNTAGSVTSSNEDGSSISSVLTSTSATTPRFCVSRDYAFFPEVITPFTWPSSQQSDGKKWNSTSGTSDWGIAQPPTAVNVTSVAAAGNITLASTIGRVYAGAYLNSTTGHYSDLNVGFGSFATGTAGPTLPGTAAQTATGGLQNWDTPNNIKLTDGTVAATTSGSATVSQFLQATNFGFAVPGGATIYGIQVSVKKAGPIGSISDSSIQLLKAGVATGDDKADTSTAWPASLTTFSYGGSSDLWGSTWTSTDVNAATFGVQFAAQIQPGSGFDFSTATADVDSVTITISYATGTGANTGAITAKQVALSLPTSNPPTGVDKFAILATLDGGDTNTFYLLDTVPIANTTYTDNTPDNVLVTLNRATEVDDFGQSHGLIDNQMPPLALQFPTKHRGRIFGAIGDTLYFSKNLDEITTSTGLVAGRYEEAFPLANAIPISTTKETILGILSDGNTLYIGTERHIWRLDGDSPLNFSKPEIIFNEVGILNQDVWQIVFAEGQPVGMMWMTPDSRVILGNFAHYQDVGTPVQDILNTRTTPSISPEWAAFFSRQEFDLYVLAICTSTNSIKSPDTLLVFDLRGQRWFKWVPTDPLTYGYFNIDSSGIPQWLIASEWGLTPSTHGGKIYQFSPTATQDRVSDTPVSFSAVIRTPWMHLGQPTAVKALNEIEVITGDSAMTVTVEGASRFAQVASPNTVVSNSALTSSFRNFLKLYLASSTAIDRHYRFTFTSSAGVQDVLQGFTVEAFPIPY